MHQESLDYLDEGKWKNANGEEPVNWMILTDANFGLFNSKCKFFKAIMGWLMIVNLSNLEIIGKKWDKNRECSRIPYLLNNNLLT